MQTTTHPRRRERVGRASLKVAGQLRRDITAGRLRSGEFLPTERDLCGQLEVSRETARRALKALECDGLIVTVPRRGYRVRPAANDPQQGCPLAYVPEPGWDDGSAAPFHAQLLESIRQAASRRGWALLAEARAGLSAADTLARLEAQRAFGAVLESPDAELVAAVRAAGLPAVTVNSWTEEAGLDAVMQDGFRGGLLAARHLREVGCRCVAWFGPEDKGAHAAERLGGALAGLVEGGVGVEGVPVVRAPAGELVARARGLLSRAERPDGVVALWRGCALALVAAAADLGLAVGRDFRMVGWCPEELYDVEYAPAFRGGEVPPVISWSVRTMAETAMARLAERRANPELPALLVKVPVRLQLAGRTAG